VSLGDGCGIVVRSGGVESVLQPLWRRPRVSCSGELELCVCTALAHFLPPSSPSPPLSRCSDPSVLAFAVASPCSAPRHSRRAGAVTALMPVMTSFMVACGDAGAA
jgi:hypothetical protein